MSIIRIAADSDCVDVRCRRCAAISALLVRAPWQRRSLAESQAVDRLAALRVLRTANDHVGLVDHVLRTSG